MLTTIDRGTSDIGAYAMRPSYIYTVTAVRSEAGWGLERVMVHVHSIYSAMNVGNLSDVSRRMHARINDGRPEDAANQWLVISVNGVAIHHDDDTETMVSGRLLGARSGVVAPRINVAGDA